MSTPGASPDIQLKPPFRRARAADARAIAELTDMASEGMTALIWEGMTQAGESALDVGARRLAETEGTFIHSNAIVAEADGKVAALLLGYVTERQGIDRDSDFMKRYSFLLPLIDLELMAPGSWYINILAVYPFARRRGLATQLLDVAARLAHAAGCAQTSLIADTGNRGAIALYEGGGFQTIARKPVVPHPRLAITGDWLLMVRGAHP